VPDPVPTIVVDASALLAFLFRERGWQTVEVLLERAHVVAPAPVVVETLYRAAERGHGLPMPEIKSALLALGMTIESVTEADTLRAADLIFSSRRTSRAGSLSLGDGLCLAVAERLGATITGGDHHWESLDLEVEFLAFR
jgi:ribonuclease VapC